MTAYRSAKLSVNHKAAQNLSACGAVTQLGEERS